MKTELIRLAYAKPHLQQQLLGQQRKSAKNLMTGPSSLGKIWQVATVEMRRGETPIINLKREGVADAGQSVEAELKITLQILRTQGFVDKKQGIVKIGHAVRNDLGVHTKSFVFQCEENPECARWVAEVFRLYVDVVSPNWDPNYEIPIPPVRGLYQAKRGLYVFEYEIATIQ